MTQIRLRSSTRLVLALVAMTASFGATLAAACGPAKMPEPPPVIVDAAPAPVVEAAPPEIPEAAPPEDPALKAKPFALCSVTGDPREVAQCLTWKSCGKGMDQTYGGKRVRHCTVTPDACDGAEKQITALVAKLSAQMSPPDAGARSCKNRMYLKKEIRLDEGRITICPDDADDAPLSALWKQLVATCREPVSD